MRLPAFFVMAPTAFLFASRALGQTEPREPQGSESAAEPENGEGTENGKPKAKGKATPLPGDDVDDSEAEPPLIPAAQDTRGGHVLLAPSAFFAVPFGRLESGVAQSSALAAGPGFGLDAGVAISRSVVLGAWGQLIEFGDGDSCAGCSAKSLGFGAFLRYHLVQGVRLDPWMSLGLGYRTTTISANGADTRYSGLEFLRLQIGGDWYPSRFIGFGPFAELDSGVYTKHADSSASSAAHFQFVIGLRLAFDLPGRRE